MRPALRRLVSPRSRLGCVDGVSARDAGGGVLVPTDSYLFRDTFSTPDQVLAANLASASSQYYEMADHADLSFTNKLTVACWIYQDTYAADTTIASKWQHGTATEWVVQVNSLAALKPMAFLSLTGNDAPSGITTADNVFTNGTWHRLAMVYDGEGATDADKFKWYVDGDSKTISASQTIPTSLADGSSPLRMGAFSGALTRYWNGRLQGLRIWADALTAAQVTADYASGVPWLHADMPSELSSLDLRLSIDTQDAPSGDLSDSENGHTLTANGSPTWALGPPEIGAASNYAAGDTLEIPNASLGALIPAGDFSFETWFKADSTIGTTNGICGVYNSSGNQRCWVLDENSNTLRFTVSSDGTVATAATESTDIQGAGWVHIVGTYNSTTGAMNLYLDNGTPATATHSGGGALFDTSADFQIFAYNAGSLPIEAGAVCGLFRAWSEELDSDDVSTLYNSDSPLRYANLPSALTTNLIIDNDCDPADLTSNVGQDLAVTSGDTINRTHAPEDPQGPPSSPRTSDVGTLTLVQTAGSLAVSGGYMESIGGSSWASNGGYHTAGVARQLGRAMYAKFTYRVETNAGFKFGWSKAASMAEANITHSFNDWPNNGSLNYWDGSTNLNIAPDVAAATEYEVIAVLRATGVFMFIKGGAFSTWTLLWLASDSSDATMRAVFAVHAGSQGITETHVRDLAPSLFRPICSASFTGSDGATIPDTDGLGHPDSNGQISAPLAWTKLDSSTWEIFSNRIRGSTSTGKIVCDPGEADVCVVCTINASSGHYAGPVMRSNGSDEWYMAIAQTSALNLFDKLVSIGSTAGTFTAGSDHVIKAFADGNELTAYGNDGSRVAATDTSYPSHTQAGCYSSVVATGPDFDDFAVYARDGHELTS